MRARFTGRGRGWRAQEKSAVHMYSEGYVGILRPSHPRADRKGYVLEHLLVAESALGRPVPRQHPVHHVDGNRTNNSPTNLVICEDNAYHKRLHRRARALRECGDASGLICHRCHRYDRPQNLMIYGRRAHHSACNAAYLKAWRLAKARGAL